MQPLNGIRVLDFTAFPPGGMCTVMLADFGAQIIRVESPAEKGKPSRVVGQVALSRGKRSITLDMRNPASSDVLKRLISSIDVVIENAKPGSMEARGFGYSQARDANSRIVWCSITGFGQSGPYAQHGGHDLSYLAHSGLLAAMNTDLPWQPSVPLSLPAGALAAVIGIQGALLERGRTGQGAHIDISLSESALWLLNCGINPLSEKPYPIPASPDRRLYACADERFVAVASCEPRTWGALCEALGVPELKGNLHKAAVAAETAERLAAVFRSRAAQEWVEHLVPLGAVVTLVNHGRQVLDDEQIRARQAVVDVGGTPVPVNPVRIAGSEHGRQAQTTAASLATVGEHTHAVLLAAGYSEQEIADLVQKGIC